MLHFDTHCHLIPGIDDGSRSSEETVLMARALCALGVERVNMTPHQFRFGNDLQPEWIRSQAGEIRRWLEMEDIEMQVRPGAEYLYGERLWNALDRGEELMAWAPEDDDRSEPHVLIELPLRQPSVGVSDMARQLLASGIRPVLAHPERVAALRQDPERIRHWQRAGWHLQLDLLSLVGTYGPGVERIARALLGQRAYAFAGSDLHRSCQIPMLARAHERFRQLALVETKA